MSQPVANETVKQQICYPNPHPNPNPTPNPNPNQVKQLMAMGFPLARALHAHEMFGDNLENILEFLTTD